jgi:hypothetical protein
VLINLIVLHHIGDETHLALQLNDVGDSGHFLRKRGLLNSVRSKSRSRILLFNLWWEGDLNSVLQ